MSVGVGLKASMPCEAVGYPQPDIIWYKKEGKMPRFVYCPSVMWVMVALTAIQGFK